MAKIEMTKLNTWHLTLESDAMPWLEESEKWKNTQ